MAITYIEQPLPETLTCAICQVNLSLDKSTAGLYDCDNNQAFACVSHLMEVEKLIIGWADFLTTELEKCRQRGHEPARLIYSGQGGYVRLNP